MSENCSKQTNKDFGFFVKRSIIKKRPSCLKRKFVSLQDAEKHLSKNFTSVRNLSIHLLNPKFLALNKLKESHAEIDAQNGPESGVECVDSSNFSRRCFKQKKKFNLLILDTTDILNRSERTNGMSSPYPKNPDEIEGFDGPSLRSTPPSSQESDNSSSSSSWSQEIDQGSCKAKASNSEASMRSDMLFQRKRRGLAKNPNFLQVEPQDPNVARKKSLQVGENMFGTEISALTPLIESQSSFSDGILEKALAEEKQISVMLADSELMPPKKMVTNA